MRSTNLLMYVIY